MFNQPYVKMSVCAGVLVTLFCSPAFGAAKPMTGVSCQGGFFVRTPDKHIHWIHDEIAEPVQVYSQNDDIYAMAECGTGVVTVFENKQTDKPVYAAFYSPNCRDIGREQGQTRNIYQGDVKINRIRPSSEGLEIRLVNNQLLRGESCSAITAVK